MSTIVPITITASPLPSNFQGNPQQFMDALVARLNVVTAVDSVAIVSQGAVAPTSNVGPWLKDGTTWYVWSTASGSYVPVSADYQTLKYVASVTAPDWRVYDLWIQLNATGTAAIGIAYWDSAGVTWRNVYDSTFLAYNEQIATASTLYPFRGDGRVDVDTVFAGAGTAEPVFDLDVTFAPNGGFAASTFTAPVGGYFRFDAKVALECTAGAPTGNEIIFGLQKNGVPLPNDATTFPIEDGVLGIRNYSLSSLLSLNFGDQIKLYASITTTAAGTWRIGKEGTFLSGSRVNAAV
jgi:hypothetical protein